MTNYLSKYSELMKNAAKLWDNQEYYDRRKYIEESNKEEIETSDIESELSLMSKFMSQLREGN